MYPTGAIPDATVEMSKSQVPSIMWTPAGCPQGLARFASSSCARRRYLCRAFCPGEAG